MKSKQLEQYIRDKHTADECIGFIDGWDKAEEYFFTNKISKMEEAINRVLDILNQDKPLHRDVLENILRKSL